MGSKILLVLGLLMAIVLVISMEVAARDLAETSTNRKQNAEEATETNGVEDSKDGGYGSFPGGGGNGPGRYGTVPGGGNGNGPGRYGTVPGGGYGNSPGYCRYGCCGGGYYGNGCRCCSYAGESVEANTKAKPHN